MFTVLRRQLLRVGCGVARRVGLAMLALIVLFASVSAGSRYFVCTMMDEARLTPCCPSESQEQSTLVSADCDCCHVKRIGELPRAFLDAPPAAPSSPSLAHPAPGLFARTYDRWAESDLPRRRAALHMRPPPLAPERARLMVFLI